MIKYTKKTSNVSNKINYLDKKNIEKDIIKNLINDGVPNRPEGRSNNLTISELMDRLHEIAQTRYLGYDTFTNIKYVNFESDNSNFNYVKLK